ncbi:MAG: ATP-grasp domain-containing protein [Patescibacteria group bacterium]|nr:ATP-grasp domain-containing protein [Patescibacteria group bacterium]
MKKKNFAFISSDLITGNIEEADKLLMNEISRRYNLIKINPNEILLRMGKNKLSLFMNGKKINKIDFALVRRTRGAEEKVYEIAKFLEKTGVKVLDNSNLLLSALSKQNAILDRYEKFNTPDTYYCNSFKSLEKFLMENKIIYPIIIKPHKGYKGEGIIKIDSKKNLIEFAKLFFRKKKENLFFQEYINIKHEYRVFVIGDIALGVVEKISRKGMIAKNYALGAEFIQIKKPKVEKLAESLCKKLKANFSGVDIIEDERGKLYILECNRSPQFIGFRNATGIKVEEKIIAYFSKKGLF